jgi:hypothetical protein
MVLSLMSDVESGSEGVAAALSWLEVARVKSIVLLAVLMRRVVPIIARSIVSGPDEIQGRQHTSQLPDLRSRTRHVPHTRSAP